MYDHDAILATRCAFCRANPGDYCTRWDRKEGRTRLAHRLFHHKREEDAGCDSTPTRIGPDGVPLPGRLVASQAGDRTCP